jgi:predicted ferric reductase
VQQSIHTSRTAWPVDSDSHPAVLQPVALQPVARAHVHGAVLAPPEPASPPRASDSPLPVVLAGWVGLAVGLCLWYINTPPGSVDSTAAVLVEAGRITGILGGYALLLQILLMSRVGWLERRVGANRLLRWHRDLGALLLILVLAHAALLIMGLAVFAQASFMDQALAVLTAYEAMVSAFVATGLLVAIGLLAVRAARAVMPYELWHLVHLSGYAVLLLSYGHVLANGRELAGPGRWYWMGLFAFVLANLVFGRVLRPLILNARHRLRVGSVVPEGHDMFSIYVHGRRLDALPARAGQFFRWRFLTRGCWWQAHPFSLSAAPNGSFLRLTVKAVGDHTEQLRWLEPGVRIFAEGPSGMFTADRRTRQRAVLIAGGSGIAPIRGLMEELPPGTIVIYRAGSADELIFADELDWLARRRGAEVHYVIGSRDDPGPRRFMTPKGLRDMVPDIQRRDVYLCGPPGLIDAVVANLKRLHLPRRQIHLDPFEL